MRVKLLISILSLNIFTALSQNNLLESFNGDFENGLIFWRFFENPAENGSFAALTTDAVSGNYAMKVNYATDYGNVVDRGFDNWTAEVPARGEASYTLKTLVKGDTNSIESFVKVKITIGFFDATGNVIGQRDRFFSLNNIYAEKSFSTKAPANAVSCWVAFRLYDAMNPCKSFRSMFIDNVRLLESWPSTVDAPYSDKSELSSIYNYPNPSIGETKIYYNLYMPGLVNLRIYDIFGQEVAVLVDNKLQITGAYELNWTPGINTGGIFFYRFEVLFESGKKTVIHRKIVFVK